MITKDGYAAVPWGERYVIIHNGFQIANVDTAAEAVEYIRVQQKKDKIKSKGRLMLDD